MKRLPSLRGVVRGRGKAPTTVVYGTRDDLDKYFDNMLALHKVMWEREQRNLERALQEIKDTQGEVCDNFELCDHRACRSSYAAWAIADEALNERAK